MRDTIMIIIMLVCLIFALFITVKGGFLFNFILQHTCKSILDRKEITKDNLEINYNLKIKDFPKVRSAIFYKMLC